jgi:hypothetical protein
MVEHEDPFDEHVINDRLRVDRWTRPVALRAMDPTRGVSSLHPDGRQGSMSSHNTLEVLDQ